MGGRGGLAPIADFKDEIVKYELSARTQNAQLSPPVGDGGSRKRPSVRGGAGSVGFTKFSSKSKSKAYRGCTSVSHRAELHALGQYVGYGSAPRPTQNVFSPLRFSRWLPV
jgi:hypothetical protein